MKTKLITAALACVLAGCATQKSTQSAQAGRYDVLVGVPFKDGYIPKGDAPTLLDDVFFQRAVQTYLWVMPLINTLGMQVGSEKTFGAGYNVLPIWKKRLDAKRLITTPNSGAIFAMSYVDLGKDGSLSLEFLASSRFWAIRRFAFAACSPEF